MNRQSVPEETGIVLDFFRGVTAYGLVHLALTTLATPSTAAEVATIITDAREPRDPPVSTVVASRVLRKMVVAGVATVRGGRYALRNG